MAVMQYCQMGLEDTSLSLSTVAERLREKVNKKRGIKGVCATNKSLKLSGNQNATKEERRYELGWRHDAGVETRQVRMKQGGGNTSHEGKQVD